MHKDMIFGILVFLIAFYFYIFDDYIEYKETPAIIPLFPVVSIILCGIFIYLAS